MSVRKEFEKAVAKLAFEAYDSIEQQKDDQHRENIARRLEVCMRDVENLSRGVAGDKDLEEGGTDKGVSRSSEKNLFIEKALSL